MIKSQLRGEKVKLWVEILTQSQCPRSCEGQNSKYLPFVLKRKEVFNVQVKVLIKPTEP